VRLTLVAVGAVVALAVTAVPAQAAGVGGIEVTPPGGTSFRVSVSTDEVQQQTFLLRNVTASPATVRLYGAAATRSEGGDAWSVGGAASADWLDLPAQEVTLAAGESREMSFSVRGGEQDRTGAVVVEKTASTVVQRAATLVHVEAAAPVPLPLLLIVLAVLVMAAAAAAWGAVVRRLVEPAPV
jgi:hypothetical protein